MNLKTLVTYIFYSCISSTEDIEFIPTSLGFQILFYDNDVSIWMWVRHVGTFYYEGVLKCGNCVCVMQNWSSGTCTQPSTPSASRRELAVQQKDRSINRVLNVSFVYRGGGGGGGTFVFLVSCMHSAVVFCHLKEICGTQIQKSCPAGEPGQWVHTAGSGIWWRWRESQQEYRWQLSTWAWVEC